MSKIDTWITAPRPTWITTVARLASPAFAVQTAETMMVFLDPLKEFPDSAFCRKSAEFVALADRKQAVPNLTEVKALLETWVLSRAPKREQVDTGISQAGLTPSDESWLETWRRHQATGFRDYAGCPRYPNIIPDTPENHLRAHVSSMIRRFSPAAWAQISAGQA